MILNNLAQGGPWTWNQRGKDSVKSCLDLAIASKNLLPFVKCMLIDKKCNFTPRRIVWRKNAFTSVYTDHLPTEVELVGMPRRKTMVVKSSTWNLGKPEGWNMYNDLTNKAAERIEKIVANSELPIDVAMKKIDDIDNEIKFTAFGKTRMNKNKQKNKIESNKQKDDKESRYLELLKRQSDKIENEILKIKSQKLGRVGNIFKMKEVISGPKKGVQEPTAIRDPTNGEL